MSTPPPTEAQITWQQVLRWRIHRHLLATDRGDGPVEIARRLSGLHAQLTNSAVIAAALRTESPAKLGADRIEQALTTDRSLVKTWAARGTLHLLPSDDLPTWTAAMSLRATERKGAWLRYHQITLEQVEQVLGAITRRLGAEPLTRDELADEVIDETGHDDLRDRLTHGFGALLKPAAARGLLAFGPPRGRHVTFVAPRRWLPAWSDVDSDGAVDTLVLAHLGSYGPADAGEFARWFSLNPPPVKRAFHRLGDRLAWVDVEGRPGAVPRQELPMLREPPSGRTVHLLPAFDPYVVGSLRQLDHIMTGGDRAQVSRPQGWISPALVVDGRIAGVWELDADRAAVTVTPFGSLTRPVRSGVTRAAERLADATGARRLTVHL